MYNTELADIISRSRAGLIRFPIPRRYYFDINIVVRRRKFFTFRVVQLQRESISLGTSGPHVERAINDNFTPKKKYLSVVIIIENGFAIITPDTGISGGVVNVHVHKNARYVCVCEIRS